MAEPTGFEPATSSVTGKRSNQLSYGSIFERVTKTVSQRIKTWLQTLPQL